MKVQPNFPSTTHCSQIIPFYDTSFFKYKNYFQGVFLPDDYSLDLKTLQHQKSQDPVLRIVYSWLINNEKPEFLTPPISGTPFSIPITKDSLNSFVKNPLILLVFTRKTLLPLHRLIFLPILYLSNMPSFRMFRSVFNKLHEHSHTGIKITSNTTTIHILTNGFLFSFTIVLNVNGTNNL